MVARWWWCAVVATEKENVNAVCVRENVKFYATKTTSSCNVNVKMYVNVKYPQ